MTEPSRSDIAGREIKSLREARGWSVRRLVHECLAAGLDVTSNVIENIEGLQRKDPKTGKPKPRRGVTVDELLALAAVLGAHPVDLLVPPDLAADEPYGLTPVEATTADRARDWIGGRAFLSEPETEAELFDAIRHLPGRRAALLYHSWHVKRRSQTDPGQRMLAQQLGLDEDPVDRLQELLTKREPNKEGRPGGPTEDIQGGEGKTGA
jgi:hypothetical protein